jgi:hypothetical protein
VDEGVLAEEGEIVPLVEELDLHPRVELPQATHLGVLPGHELLREGRQLDEAPVVGKVEVRPEGGRR